MKNSCWLTNLTAGSQVSSWRGKKLNQNWHRLSVSGSVWLDYLHYLSRRRSLCPRFELKNICWSYWTEDWWWCSGAPWWLHFSYLWWEEEDCVTFWLDWFTLVPGGWQAWRRSPGGGGSYLVSARPPTASDQPEISNQVLPGRRTEIVRLCSANRRMFILWWHCYSQSSH